MRRPRGTGRALEHDGHVLPDKQLLIVDQDPRLAQGCAAVLREQGYAARVALGADEALASLGDFRPELVILNTRMGKGESYRVLALLRLTDGASIPVLALAAEGPERERWGPAPLGMEFASPRAGAAEMVAAVERLVGPAAVSVGCRCALCEGISRESALSFVHLRRGERATLEVALCESCGNKLEKHLKRAIPKRLMRLAPTRYGGRLARTARDPEVRVAGG